MTTTTPATYTREQVKAALAAVDQVRVADTAFLSVVARDYGADSTPAANLRELLALRKLAEAVRDEQDVSGEIAAIVDSWYERYARFSRIEEDTYLALRNRLIPLSPGDPVQFREPGKTRWFNGTFEGPVDNPDDPQRSGDAVVLSRSGRRVSVFLSSVRRAS